MILSDGDIYFHPKEGNEYVTIHYLQSSIVKSNGKLWVKSMNMEELENDEEMSSVGENVLSKSSHYVVPKTSYFMVNKKDISTDDLLLNVKKEEIIGVAKVIYFSISNFERIGMKL